MKRKTKKAKECPRCLGDSKCLCGDPNCPMDGLCYLCNGTGKVREVVKK